VQGSLKFEARVAHTNSAGVIVLDQVTELAASDVYAVVYDGQQQAIGEGFVDEQGAFDVPLQGPIDGATAIYFVTLATTSDNQKVVLAVVQPESGGAPTPGKSLNPWVWNALVPANGVVGDLVITEAQGSGALFLFEYTFAAMAQVMIDLANGDETHLTSLAVLWAPNLSWSCGSCYSRDDWQTLQGSDAKLDQSIFIGGEADGSSAWGWPVILHEFGHYTAKNYSEDDSPGGPHTYGTPVTAPMAWSEGWASFFAVMTMSRWLGEPRPVFWDIQAGNSFWLDYHHGKNPDEQPIEMPDPQGGMDQDLDESWVAMALWDLWDGADVADFDGTDVDGTALGTEAVLNAFGGLFWTSFDALFDIPDRGAAGVDFVDFVDRIVCANPNLAQSVMATVAWEGFPYDGNADCN